MPKPTGVKFVHYNPYIYLVENIILRLYFSKPNIKGISPQLKFIERLLMIEKPVILLVPPLPNLLYFISILRLHRDI